MAAKPTFFRTPADFRAWLERNHATAKELVVSFYRGLDVGTMRTDMGETQHAIRIERATPRDVPVVLQMIRALAEYERMLDDVVATEEGIREALFGPRPDAEVLLAYAGDEPAGFALFFHNFSTFVGRRGLYLEDLFVKPELRGRGIGKRLLAELARIAVERNCGRFEWTVLDWNAPSIAFYRSLGARKMEEWQIFRLDGDALTRLAEQAPTAMA